eukprot:scaffold44552_cov30-Attheya_sp.AAC.1
MSKTSKYEKKRKCADAKSYWNSKSKSSSQLYHSVLTTYYSADIDCRKQYLVLLFDPRSGAGSAGSS